MSNGALIWDNLAMTCIGISFDITVIKSISLLATYLEDQNVWQKKKIYWQKKEK